MGPASLGTEPCLGLEGFEPCLAYGPGQCARSAVAVRHMSRTSPSTCGAPHGTRYVRHARGSYAYGVRSVAQQLPCASGAYATQEAGTRSLYVQYGGSGRYGSAQPSALWKRLRCQSVTCQKVAVPLPALGSAAGGCCCCCVAGSVRSGGAAIDVACDGDGGGGGDSSR